MDEHSRQVMQISLLLAGSALLATAEPRAPIHLAWSFAVAGDGAASAAAPCLATDAGAPSYFEAVALAVAASDGPLPVDAGCGRRP